MIPPNTPPTPEDAEFAAPGPAPKRPKKRARKPRPGDELRGVEGTEEGLRRKAEVLDDLEARNAEWTSLMRDEAERLIRLWGPITAEDTWPYRDELARRGIVPSHKYAIGGLFRGDARFVFVEERLATDPRKNGKKIKVWRLA